MDNHTLYIHSSAEAAEQDKDYEEGTFTFQDSSDCEEALEIAKGRASRMK